MDAVKKTGGRGLKKADAEKDIVLINQYSLKELRPDEVFCFSVNLCDNEIDRDNERFTDKALRQLAKLFIGKTGIFDHRWSATGQTCRLYRAEVVKGEGNNALGEPLKILRGSAYMLRNEHTSPTIDNIEAGIIKEVSVGVGMDGCTCSICGKRFGWRTCEEGHVKGDTYDGKLCYGELDKAKDAYEFSFVAVPAQRGAGITKDFSDTEAAIDTVLEANLEEFPEQLKALKEKIEQTEMSGEERARRAAFLTFANNL